MKTKFTLKEIEVAIKDPNYLKYQNASKKEIAVAEEIIKGKYEKFPKADDSDNFKFPYYEGILKGKDMSMIFNNSKILFRERRNKETELKEFYNIMYQYETDCLVASLEYNKNYYSDRDLKPTEELFFSLTIIPLSKLNTPSLSK